MAHQGAQSAYRLRERTGNQISDAEKKQNFQDDDRKRQIAYARAVFGDGVDGHFVDQFKAGGIGRIVNNHEIACIGFDAKKPFFSVEHLRQKRLVQFRSHFLLGRRTGYDIAVSVQQIHLPALIQIRLVIFVRQRGFPDINHQISDRRIGVDFFDKPSRTEHDAEIFDFFHCVMRIPDDISAGQPRFAEQPPILVEIGIIARQQIARKVPISVYTKQIEFNVPILRPEKHVQNAVDRFFILIFFDRIPVGTLGQHFLNIGVPVYIHRKLFNIPNEIVQAEIDLGQIFQYRLVHFLLNDFGRFVIGKHAQQR